MPPYGKLDSGDGVSATYVTPSGTTSIVAGLYISKPPSTAYTGINLGASGSTHPLGNCRLYFSLKLH